MIELWGHQLDALNNMHNGCVLCGGVGSGKSITALAYFFKENGGKISKKYEKPAYVQDLYIITTPRKRDSKEWERDMSHFLLSPQPDYNNYDNIVVVDSWNNIKKYTDIKDGFFIFDEHKLSSDGVWSKSFLKIAQKNKWILLSATPGDTWKDYMYVFIANGFYKNKSDFIQQHIIYKFHPGVASYPQIDRYVNEQRLIRLRNNILVDMPVKRPTIPHHEDIIVNYPIIKYMKLRKTRWDEENQKPIETAAELCYLERKVVNSDESRQIALLEIVEDHPRIIVFYNYDYELDLLKSLTYPEDMTVAEYNGHKHEPIPDTPSWIYLTQYTASCEAWNCIKTDTIVFYSQNYSYKTMIQCAGRIDRLNTSYVDLYYYHLRSYAPIDRAIHAALERKEDFNEGRYFYKG